ncbi:GNAT family N-acetyltransferase, partial [Muribaculaceae bacterium Isolate-002 (NCI)]
MEVLAALPRNRRLAEDGRYAVYLLQGNESPLLLDALTRRREEAFRALGEGSGRERDQDRYDAHYEHLLLVDEKGRALAGAYRTRLVRPELARTYGR